MIFASSVQNIDTDDTSSNNSNEVIETHTEQVWTSQSHRGLTYQESANWWECVRCTYHNSQDTNKCQICKQIKGGGRAITRSLTSHQQPHASASNSHDDINIIEEIHDTTPIRTNTSKRRRNNTSPLISHATSSSDYKIESNEEQQDISHYISQLSATFTSASNSQINAGTDNIRSSGYPTHFSTELHNEENPQMQEEIYDLSNEEEIEIDERFQDNIQNTSSSSRHRDRGAHEPYDGNPTYKRSRRNKPHAQNQNISTTEIFPRTPISSEYTSNHEVIVLSSDTEDNSGDDQTGVGITSPDSNTSKDNDETKASQFHVASSARVSSTKAILDTGASTTTFRSRRMFKYLKPVHLTVSTASKDATLKCEHMGPVSVFNEAFWIPDLSSDLISVGALDEVGIEINIKNGHMIGKYDGHIIFDVIKKRNIWRINTDDLISILDTTVGLDQPNRWWAVPIGIEEKIETKRFLALIDRLWLWHRRLFHASVRRIIVGLNKGVLNLGDTELASNLKELTVDIERFKTEKCSSCAKSKSAAQPRLSRPIQNKTIQAPSSRQRISNPEYVDNPETAQGFVQGYIATDMCGPFTTRTIKGAFIGVQAFLDMGSKWSYPYFYRNKSDAISNLKNLVEEQLKRDKVKLEHYHSDGANELCGTETRKYLSQLGVKTSWTSPSAPQENSVVERHFGSMMRCVVAMFEQARYIPKGLWNFAVETFCFIFNRMPTTTGKGWMSPYEYRNGKPADLSWLKVWGCKMYVNIPLDKRAKNFNPRAQVGYLVGFSEFQKNAYKVWIPSTNRVIISRDAIADESIPTGNIEFSTDEYWREARQFTKIEREGERQEEDYYYLVGLEFYDPDEDMKCVVTRIEVEGRSRYIVGYYKRIIHDVVEDREHQRMHVADIEKLMGIFAPDDDQEHAKLCSSTPAEGAVHSLSACRSDNITDGGNEHKYAYNDVQETSDILSRIDLPELPGEANYLCALESAGITPFEPNTYKEAMECEDRDHWKQAIQNEHENLRKKEVLKEVMTPNYPHRRIGSKYVFKVKIKNGVVDKYKVRIVAKGYNQILDLDYNESFAPVARFNTLRIFLTLSLAKKHFRKSVDVVAAYLNSPITEELYLETPEGMACKSGYTLKLEKALYGLKQAGRNWYLVLKRYLTEREGFKCCLSEHCVFINTEKDMMIIVYVDDLIVSGKVISDIDSFFSRLKATFELGEPTELDWYLGIGIQEVPEGIFLTQEKYVEKIADKYGYNFNVEDTIDTPMIENLSIIKDPADELFDDFDMKSRIGSLMFASVCTRPDIAYAVSYLARYTTHPSKEVCKAINRVFKYLVGTKELGIFIPKNDETIMRVYCDSDYGGDKNDFKSTSGIIVYLGQSVVSWYTSKQTTTAQSSCDAEIVAMNHAAKEIVWMRGLLEELGAHQANPTKLFCDNQGAIQLAHNPVFHKRTKHIMIKFSYLVEQLQKDEIILNYIKSAENISDMFTKAEKALHFLINRKKLNMQISGKTQK